MSAVAMRWAALRLLLLVLVAVGVGGMHTIGHPTDDHGTQLQPVVHLMAGQNASFDVEAGGVGLPPVHPGGGLDPTTVCLAILTAAGATGLLASALRAIGRLPVAANGVGRLFPNLPSRAPPPARRGLVLADLSVLRI